MHMIYDLVRDTAIVLQDVVVLDVLRDGYFLGYGEDLGELVVGDVVEFCAVVFGDDELGSELLAVCEIMEGRKGRTYRVPFGEGTNVEECVGLVAFEDLHRGDFTSFSLVETMRRTERMVAHP